MKYAVLGLMILAACGDSYELLPEYANYVSKVEAFYDVNLGSVQVVVGDTSEACNSEIVYGCAKANGTVYVANGTCGEVTHELMHLAALQLFGHGDSDHQLLDWSLPWHNGFCE